MNAKHRKVLERIHRRPTPADIAWVDVLSLFVALGADISTGRGSRIRFDLYDTSITVHKPHPSKECPKRLIVSVREFLKEHDVSPDQP